MIEIHFTEKSATAMGRNGIMYCRGLYVSQTNYVVTIRPINSKGHIGNCYIDIPLKNLQLVIEKLMEAL